MGISTITSSSEGVWSRNPDTLPRTVVNSQNCGFKSNVGTIVLLNAAGMQTTLAYLGATASITADDTYATICDVTGSGFLFHVISACSGASNLRTIKITIDGTVYTLATADAIGAYSRMIIGPGFASGAIATTDTGIVTSHPGQIGGYNYDVFAARDGGCMSFAQGDLLIPTENEVLSRGLPAIRFESSLKVEVKSQTKNVGADPYNAAVALYRVDL